VTASIGQIESWIGSQLPDGYRDFLTLHENEFAPNGRVLLYGLALFLERNETYEVKLYCPGFVTIGNDSGDMEFILSLNSGCISRVDGGSMRPEHAEPVAEDFSAWLDCSCPLPESPDPPYSAIEKVAVYLETKPKSAKTLLLIRQHLCPDTPISDLRNKVASVPCAVAQSLTYMQATIRCAHVNAVDPCLGIRLARDNSVKLSLTWRDQA
jgi:hypothetical protein